MAIRHRRIHHQGAAPPVGPVPIWHMPANEGAGNPEEVISGTTLTLGSGTSWLTGPNRLAFNDTSAGGMLSTENQFPLITTLTDAFTLFARLQTATPIPSYLRHGIWNYGSGAVNKPIQFFVTQFNDDGPVFIEINIRASGVSDALSGTVSSGIALNDFWTAATTYDGVNMETFINNVSVNIAAHPAGGNIDIPGDDRLVAVGAEINFTGSSLIGRYQHTIMDLQAFAQVLTTGEMGAL